MRTLLVSVLLIGVITAAVIGIVLPDQKDEKKPETFADVKSGYFDAIKKAQDAPDLKKAEDEIEIAKKAMQDAKSPEAAKAIRERLTKAATAAAAIEEGLIRPVNKEYSLKFLQFAQSHKDDQFALESI